MRSMSVAEFEHDLYRTLWQVNEDAEPVAITTSEGKGAVLVGEDEWAAIEETLYLTSIPGMAQSIKDAAQEPLDDAIPASNVGW